MVAKRELDPAPPVPLLTDCVTSISKFTYSSEKCNDINPLWLWIGLNETINTWDVVGSQQIVFMSW